MSYGAARYTHRYTHRAVQITKSQRMSRIARGILWLSAPLAVLAFWSGLVAAALRFPGGYDWIYQPISNLLYPDRNPQGYLWGWAGIELCGLGGLAWTTQLSPRGLDAPFGSRVGGLWPLRVGFICTCAAVLPDQWLPLSKGHEFLAVLAFLGICCGMVRQIFAAIGRRVSHSSSGAARLAAPIGASVPLIPVALAALTQAYLSLARPDLPWVSPAWRARGVPLYLSFAVWQWAACAVFSVCLLALSRLTRPTAVAISTRGAALSSGDHDSA